MHDPTLRGVASDPDRRRGLYRRRHVRRPGERRGRRARRRRDGRDGRRAPRGTSKRGVALVRPPGHHARPDHAMGFCLLNNVAIAAAHARARGVDRVAIVDWDVHHGNGTQDAFVGDPQRPLHLDAPVPVLSRDRRGQRDRRGRRQGLHGQRARSRRAAATASIARRSSASSCPSSRSTRPQLVLVSAGFDASARDPLAEMALSADAFGWMARALRGVADKSADGRIALVLEGGYDLVALEAGLLAATRGDARGHGARHRADARRRGSRSREPRRSRGVEDRRA